MADLTERRLVAESGDVIFDRGADYVRYVVGLRVAGSRASASVQAKRVYLVELDWAGKEIKSSCTCPHFDQGFFCKHVVAVGLAAIDRGRSGAPADPPGKDAVALVAALDEDELRVLLAELADRDPGVRRALELRASARSGDVSGLVRDLDALVKDTLSVRGFIDYRRSFEIAREAQEMLDQLESVLDDGHTDAVGDALLRAVTRLRKLVGQADDSSGSMGDAGQRALELYARACREGSPDGKKLARWLVKFRDTSPGWPETTLGDFVDCFDEAALATYRREVDKVDTSHGAEDGWQRFEVTRMQLELADHDGDVDRAVELLAQGEHPSYGAIVERLRSVGRGLDAVGWIDRAVAAGRISGRNGGNDYWLDPAAVSATYRELGRDEDGLDVLRREFESNQGLSAFRQLLTYAAAIGQEAEQREWALATAGSSARRPYPAGAVLVEIALGEGDLDAAWAAAKTYGAGHRWRQLADSSADFAPSDAADLHREQAEQSLGIADAKRYPGIVDHLVAMRDLQRKAGTEEQFAAYVAGLRETYQRRSLLMKELAARGL